MEKLFRRCTIFESADIACFFLLFSGEGEIDFVHPLRCRGHPCKKKKQTNLQINLSFCLLFFLRRGRDSNPRYLSVRRFSRPVQSTTLPPLQKCIFCCRNVVSLFNECKGIAYFGIVQENCEKYFFVFPPVLCVLCIYVAMLYACLFF